MNSKIYYVPRLASAVLLLAGFAVQGVFANQSTGQVVGEAFGLESSELLYSEIHCGIDDHASEVIYQQSDGTLIAHKLLDYQSGAITPSFIQHNVQSEEKIEVRFDQLAVSMSVTTSGALEQEKRHPVSDNADKPVVIDAGFDGFIRTNWATLIAGDTLEFQFPLASRSSMVSLRVKPSACSYESDSDQCFTLEPSNWLYRMLSAPIELGYDPKYMRLARYRGLSNINDETGKGLVVDIKYSYQASTVAACDVGRLLLSENANSTQVLDFRQP